MFLFLFLNSCRARVSNGGQVISRSVHLKPRTPRGCSGSPSQKSQGKEESEQTRLTGSEYSTMDKSCQLLSAPHNTAKWVILRGLGTVTGAAHSRGCPQQETNFQEEAVNDGPPSPSPDSFGRLGDSVGSPDLALLAFSPFSRAGLLLASGRLLGTDTLYGHRATGLGAGRDLTHSSGLAAFLESQAPFETDKHTSTGFPSICGCL